MSEHVGRIKVMNLKPDMRDVNIVVRVISAEEPKSINTRSGQRTISEALVGDDTGRIKLTLWGKAAGSVKEGQAIRLSGAWTTAFRGEVQLNIGGSNNVHIVDDSEVPQADEIPNQSPKVPEGYRPQRRGFRRQGKSFRSRRW